MITEWWILEEGEPNFPLALLDRSADKNRKIKYEPNEIISFFLTVNFFELRPVIIGCQAGAAPERQAASLLWQPLITGQNQKQMVCQFDIKKLVSRIWILLLFKVNRWMSPFFRSASRYG